MPLSFGAIPLLRALPSFTVLSIALSSITVFCSPSDFVCAGGNVRGEGGRDWGFVLGDSAAAALSKGLIVFGDGALVLTASIAAAVVTGFGGEVRVKEAGDGDFVFGDVGTKEVFVEVVKVCFWTGEVCGDLVDGGGVRVGDLIGGDG